MKEGNKIGVKEEGVPNDRWNNLTKPSVQQLGVSIIQIRSGTEPRLRGLDLGTGPRTLGDSEDPDTRRNRTVFPTVLPGTTVGIFGRLSDPKISTTKKRWKPVKQWKTNTKVFFHASLFAAE